MITNIQKQEYIPVGCVQPAIYRTGVSPDRDPLDRDPSWTETSLDGDPSPQPRQRSSLDRDPSGQSPPGQTPPDRDPPGL